jgi:ribosome-associated protein
MEKPPNQSPTPEKFIPMVPESEMTFEAMRSSGPGGQNVQKTNTKVRARWNVSKSADFDDDQKEKILAYVRTHHGKQLNEKNEIFTDSQSERSQLQNREDAVRKLQELVAEALTPQKERKDTKGPRGQKEKRLDEKKKDSRKKQDRRGGGGEW